MSMSYLSNSLVGSNLFVFTHDELSLITNNFALSNYLGEGGFGAVYKGFIDDKLKPGLGAQLVDVKMLDLEGTQGHKEWLAEVIFLGQLRHHHLVKLIGYCPRNYQRSLVYEYMEMRNLDSQLFRRCSTPLPWLTRMKIAVETAKGLAFLHEEKQAVIFRDFKAANILWFVWCGSAVLFRVTLMLFACIVWMKLISYAHTNYDMRIIAKASIQDYALPTQTRNYHIMSVLRAWHTVEIQEQRRCR